MKKLMTAEDMTAIVSVTDPQYTPDGKRVAYVKSQANKEKDSYTSNIWVYDADSGTSAPWTYGEKRSTDPRWSPDGRQIAFVSDRDGDVSQIYIMSAEGGEAKKLTDIPYGVSQPVWSPDGESVLVTVSLGDEESVYDQEKTEPDSFEPVEVHGLAYKRDGKGLTRGAYAQLVLVSVKSGEVKQLTNEKADHFDPAFSPDGKSLVFSANMTETDDARKPHDVCMLSLETEDLKLITSHRGSFGPSSFSPDGRYLALLGHEQEYRNATLEKAWVYDIEQDRLSCLTDMLDVHLADALIGDSLIGGAEQRPVWTKDSQGFYVIGTEQGSTGIYYVSIEGLVYPIRLEKEYINSFSMHPDEHSFIASVTKPGRPSELYSILLGQEEKRLTDANDKFVDEHLISLPEDIQYVTEDGMTVNGWLMKPAQAAEGKNYSLILNIHGGPHMMYGHTYFHEFQVLAAKGYAVVYVNPRGSHGYGQEFVNAVRGDYGGKDYQDVMQAVDEAIKRDPQIDAERIGVTGGSYGGFMTNWIVGQTNRFKAAVTQRSISNWLSFHGVSDIGYFFTDWQLEHDMFTDTEKLWDRSPLKYAANVETPLLILHGERDDRCPIEQAEQLFIALKKMDKETVLVRFPKASHNLSRSGHPGQRIKRLTYISSWFDQYLS
ncbi:S9 family peptidase [Bacillus mojavensis]|uniref:S9 family peptidase n=1 Tax=Bacillus mojavensis TaxID=72360 RepID=UPI002DB72E4A|nr:S9 family peptidase [Bacillus mojavensis]MEC1614372.1 S9 family peptidase [Bacillus mojavensis]MEC1634629.1 S9 family peptidase [Bacillus mojavensis]MEC1691526.1 S9 family peptidase [Bacillus mojavensis]MEC1731769.1 S9 family peptidase [Bacillus mojavensis]MED1005850.1 S9 family peptidase [Bacillus mojavensis]